MQLLRSSQRGAAAQRGWRAQPAGGGVQHISAHCVGCVEPSVEGERERKRWAARCVRSPRSEQAGRARRRRALDKRSRAWTQCGTDHDTQCGTVCMSCMAGRGARERRTTRCARRRPQRAVRAAARVGLVALAHLWAWGAAESWGPSQFCSQHLVCEALGVNDRVCGCSARCGGVR